VGGVGLIHLPMIGSQTVSGRFGIDQKTIGQRFEPVLYGQFNGSGHSFVGFVHRRKPLGIVLGFSLGPYLLRFGVRSVGVDKVQPVVTGNGRAPSGPAGMGYVFDDQCDFIILVPGFFQLYGDLSIVVFILQILSVLFSFDGLDVKIFGIQDQLLDGIQVGSQRNF